MGIEATMRQAGFFHDGGQTDAPIACAANGPSRNFQDAVVGQFLSAGGG